MFSTLRTLFAASSATAEERVRDAHAIALIDQKIREAEASLRNAKATLASLVQRQRSETKQADTLRSRIADMSDRAKQALDTQREDLAQQAAEAIAGMENELVRRDDTIAAIDSKVMRLRTSVEAAHRRIIDLKQGAISARAVRREQLANGRMSSALAQQGAMEEAEELIQNVLSGDDPVERSEILSEINADLTHDTLADKMADAGLGGATRSTAADVLKRLKS